jgi:hypothetical protein
LNISQVVQIGRTVIQEACRAKPGIRINFPSNGKCHSLF